jgi:hypothetical protein
VWARRSIGPSPWRRSGVRGRAGRHRSLARRTAQGQEDIELVRRGGSPS